MDWTEPSARVIADSESPFDGSRLITVEMRHHRFVLAEANTHGSAKNSASSRARPTAKMVAEVLTDVAMPVEFGALQPGMQAGPPLTGKKLHAAQMVWIRGALGAVETTLQMLLSPDVVRAELDRHGVSCLAEVAGVGLWETGASIVSYKADRAMVAGVVTAMIERGEQSDDDDLLRVHKQIANRPLEPYMWHTSVHTAIFDGKDLSSWVNFMVQRCSPADGSKSLAQPEFTAVADRIREAIGASAPTVLAPGMAHLPYVRDDERDLPAKAQIVLAVARVARTSYLTQNGVRDRLEDFRLYRRLATATPPHWSPFEHVALPVDVRVAGRFGTWSTIRHSDPEKRRELLAFVEDHLALSAA